MKILWKRFSFGIRDVIWRSYKISLLFPLQLFFADMRNLHWQLTINVYSSTLQANFSFCKRIIYCAGIFGYVCHFQVIHVCMYVCIYMHINELLICVIFNLQCPSLLLRRNWQNFIPWAVSSMDISVPAKQAINYNLNKKLSDNICINGLFRIAWP